MKPFVPGQRVEVNFYLNGNRIETKKVKVNGGSFRARIRIEEAGKYAASARLPGQQDPARRHDGAQELARQLPVTASGASAAMS